MPKLRPIAITSG